MEFIKESNKVKTNVDNNEKAKALRNTARTESNESKKIEEGSSSSPSLTVEAKGVVLSHQKETKKNTPTLAQIGRQVSLNFRNSQLYDSGAESCYDNDEQSNLLRTPSTRSQHKFIIIPSSAPGTENSSTLRQTISASGLNAISAMSAVIQQKPPLASGMRNKSQRPLSTASTSSTFKLLTQFSGNLSDADIDESYKIHPRLQQHSRNTSQTNSKSADVIHQNANTASTSSNVRFTLDEANQSDFVDAQTTTTTPTTTTTTTAEINNTAKTNNNNSNTYTLKDSAQKMPSVINFKRSSSSSSTLKPLAINSSGQSPNNESMRSVASGMFEILSKTT